VILRAEAIVRMPSPSEPATETAARRGAGLTVASPYFALAVLFSMNLLNYIDRYVFFSAGPRITKELKFDDAEFGTLSVSFMVVYTLVSPLVGWLGDRYNRKRLLAFGVGLWSVATVGTAFAWGFHDMFAWRALLGVGEASYGIIAPTLLADLFTPKRRGRVMGVYYLALPLGGALGYLIGGHFAEHGDWRHAFWVVGLPGLAAALAGLMMSDPGRGASEGKAKLGKADRPGLGEYLAILKTPSFLYNTAGQAAVTFAIGGYAVWGPTFYNRIRGMDYAQAGREIGALSALAGLLGIGLGTVAADAIRKLTRRAYLVWPALAVAVAVPCATLALLEPDRRWSLGYLFVASVMMASVLGPCNAVTANVVAANRRAAGFALSIFLVHLFGDISSPLLIGKVSQLFGTTSVMGSPLGRFFDAIGADPVIVDKVPTNLTAAMLAVVPMLALGCLFFLLGAKHLPADQERARLQRSGDDPLDDGSPFVH
jgi:MFS family permease